MQPQNAPAAPPPIPPNQVNPYEFLNEPPKQKGGSLLAIGGASKKQRIIVVAIIAIVLMILAIVIYGLLSSAGSVSKQDLTSLEQQQAELIRVADIGVLKANQPDAKSMAVTTKFTILSQQAPIQALAKKSGLKLSAKQLAAGKNTKTDATLTSAEQTNQFDEVFTQTIKTELLTYRRTLQKVRSEVSSKKTRETLKTYDTQISTLVPEESTPANQ